MDLMQEERKKNTYNTSFFGEKYANLMYKALLYEKVDNHEKRVTDIESELKELRELIHPDNHMTNDNQFSAIKQNAARLDEYVNRGIDNKRVERRLENIVSELSEVEDKKLQVQIVGELVDEIKGILKDVPKQKNNYRRQMLLMFHEALKQNYAKDLFNEKQVKTLIEVARVCNEAFVTREQYFKMDNILCECDLDMIPDLE